MDTKRTDIHRPSEIIPSDYEYVAVWTMNIQGLGDAIFMQQEREACKRHMERTGGKYSAHEHGGACDVCGNSLAIYLVLFYHAKSNEYIRVGVNCTTKLGMSGDEARMNLFKKNVRDAREAQAGKRKALALLEDSGLGDAWDIFSNQTAYLVNVRGTDVLPYEERILADMVTRLVKYGSISDKTKSYAAVLLKKIADRPIVEAQRQAEKDAAGPVPLGRVKMTGEVVGMKEVEGQSFSYYDSGVRTKLIIKLDNGSKVYGNRFANLNKGDRVEFIATVEASKDDTKFGFFSRAKLPPRELSKEEKAGVKMLKRIQKHLPMGTYEAGAINDTWEGAITCGNLIDDIKKDGLS